VLGGDSVVLDLGRTQRLHTASQAKALSVHHETCAAEGCQRPFAWCDIHHVHPWSLGGPTDLDNALPLCGWHHRRAHDDAFTMTLLPTGEVRYRRRR
jgi:predicted restriction endonuclease